VPYPLRKILSVVVTGLLLLIAKPGLAINYDVELIIFEHITNTGVGSSATYLYPVVDGAQQIPQDVTEPTALLQPLPQLRLAEDAEKIRQSGNHRLLYHGGWRQTDFDRENAPFMAIALGARQEVFVEQGDPDSNYLRGFKLPPLNLNQNMQSRNIYQLFGGVKVWVGRFLHFDTRLAYTPANGKVSYKFESERRMRSRQMHYIDHSRVGVLVKIFPVDETAAN
jgi:hypothetical protein